MSRLFIVLIRMYMNWSDIDLCSSSSMIYSDLSSQNTRLYDSTGKKGHCCNHRQLQQWFLSSNIEYIVSVVNGHDLFEYYANVDL
jgi:hypothetical protein